MSVEQGTLNRVLSIAKKDYRDAVQSRALWALVVVFVVITVISSYAFVEAPELFGGPTAPSFGGLIFFTAAVAALFVPIAAIITCYKSLAGERELGSIKVVMSLPATRSDVFFGKVFGRGAVLTTALGVGVLIGLAFGAVLLGTIAVGPTAVFLAVTVLFAVAYTAIMVSLSALTNSTAKATTYALGFFVIFELLWDVIPLGILYVVEGFRVPTQIPDWFITAAMVSPGTAYFSAINAVLPDLANGSPDGAGVGVDVTVENGDQLFTSSEMGLFFLLLWIVVPLAIGYYRFARTDL